MSFSYFTMIPSEMTLAEKIKYKQRQMTTAQREAYEKEIETRSECKHGCTMFYIAFCKKHNKSMVFM